MIAAVTQLPGAREQTRARYPDETGFVERDGVRVFWERYGAGAQTILFLPTWEIVYSRVWKCQMPYFARRFQVVTFDPRGNGRSDRPSDVDAYDRREVVGDAIQILDSLGIDRAAVVSWCSGVGVLLAAEHPERVSALVEIAPDLPLTIDPGEQQGYSFDEERIEIIHEGENFIDMGAKDRAPTDKGGPPTLVARSRGVAHDVHDVFLL